MENSEQDKQKRVDQLLLAIERVYNHPGRLAARGFLFGLMSGLGATLGVAIVIWLLGFVIHRLGGLPVVGDWFNGVGQALPNY